MLLALLRSESRAGGFSDPGVRVSLLLDIDANRVKSQRDYARIWGWSYKRVRYHWDSIWQDVVRLTCSMGRQMDADANPLLGKVRALQPEWYAWAVEEYGEPKGAHEGRTKGAKNGDKSTNKAEKGRTKGARRAQHTSKHPSSSHPSNPPETTSPSPPAGGDGFSLPDWIDREAWAGFVEMRQKSRSPLTDRAKTLAVKRLERLRSEGQDPNAVLDQSTENGWKTVYPIKANGSSAKQRRDADRPDPDETYRRSLEIGAALGFGSGGLG